VIPEQAARRWPRRSSTPSLRRLAVGALGALTVTAASLAISAPPVAAFGTPLGCTGRVESTYFAAWGDRASYFLVSNGAFEAGSGDWSLGGGSGVSSGNEPWKVAGATHAKSLRIPAGGSAESRTLCVSRGEDSIRLFVKNARVSGSILHVEAIVRNPTTGATAQTAFDVNGDAAPLGWAPTMRLGIPNLLGGSGTQELTLVFTTRGAAATWFIDDIFVDPFKSY
jgi:hypothetical protein